MTDPKPSRQRAYQQRRKAAGCCILCPLPRDAGSQWYCRTHKIAHRERQRARSGSQPWRPGKPGRPPNE